MQAKVVKTLFNVYLIKIKLFDKNHNRFNNAIFKNNKK